MFKVGLYVDEMASWSSTPESEYDELETLLRAQVFLAGDVRFIREVAPHALRDRPDLDVYVVDFGGLAAMPGTSSGSVLSRAVIAAVREQPSTYFLIWSCFTARHFRYELEEELGTDELSPGQLPPNVLMYPERLGGNTDEELAVLARLRGLLGIAGEPVPDAPRRAEREPSEDGEDDA